MLVLQLVVHAMLSIISVSTIYFALVDWLLERFSYVIFALNSSLSAADIKLMGINVCGRCLISENHKHLIVSKYTRYTVYNHDNHFPPSLSPKGDFSYKVIDHASRALVEVEWIESHRSVNFEKSMFKEAESVSRATWAVSQAVEKHAFLVILLSNAYNQCAKYLFIAQNE